MLKKYYTHENNVSLDKIIKENCREHKCVLKGNYKDYIILDGDEIKDNLLPGLKSVDCIIISKKPYDGNKIDVIMCELGGDKKWADVKKKMIDSSEHFVSVINDSDFEIGKFICCFLGKYKNPKQIKKQKRANINIHDLGRHNVKIHNFNCGWEFERIINL